MATTLGERPAPTDAVRDPSVLVVLIARDAAGWLRECLQSLASQTHARLGVVAVDNASSDATPDLLEHALGPQRVIRLRENLGIAGALRAATDLPATQAADYLLVLHDDTALGPDAVSRLVEAAEGIGGVERVGIVGPKVVDWDDRRLLREVGRSTDRFGHPYTPLQDGERDQGQYDRVLEVLFVSSCAMLISREAWRRTGLFDERYAGHHDDLDFCWRARLAGFRVLMTPLAVARHRAARDRGERVREHRRRSSRYYAERAALASMLKDYGIPTLLWLLPVYMVVGLARLVFLVLSRRFEDAYDLVAAWGWNLLHLPGTLRRRVRAQSVRAVRDGAVRRFMAATFRLPRWFERAEEFLEEDWEAIDEDDRPRPIGRRAASLAAGHPVLLGSVVGIVLGALAIRHFVGPEAIDGGALASLPAAPADAFRELISGVRTTGLGGSQPASPALAAIGAVSWLSFGSAELAEKVLLAALLPLAAVVAYRAFARQTARPATAVVGAGAYLLSATALWAFSEGRVGLLVAIAALPVVWDRLDGAFSARRLDGPFRHGVGLGTATAIALAFLPGIALGVGLITGAHVLAGRRRARGLGIVLVAAVTAALLAFPVVGAIVSEPAAALSSYVGTDDPWSVLRLAPGRGAGTWALSAFLPLAAAICLAAAERAELGRAVRAMAVAVTGTGLAWLSAAGYLADAVANPPAYLATAAFAEAAVIAYGAPGLVSGLERQAFGARQIGAAVLAMVLGIGIGAQALQVTLAEWEVRPNGLPPAWPVVDADGDGEFRILWIGAPYGDRFAAPGGDPLGVVEAGAASVRFGLTDREGATALDTGRASTGPGYDYLRSAVGELVGGETSHGGALLAPLGVRFVVAGPGDLPPDAAARLEAQTDLDRVPAGGITIFRNAATLPTAFAADDASWTSAGGAMDPAVIASRPAARVHAIASPGSGHTARVREAAEVVVADQFDPAWRFVTAGEEISPRPAFGWAIASSEPIPAGRLSYRYADQWMRTLEIALLAALWAATLWVTRRPVSA